MSDADIEQCRDRQALVLLAQQQSGSSLSVDELKHILKSRGISEDAEIWKLLDEGYTFICFMCVCTRARVMVLLDMYAVFVCTCRCTSD